MSKYIQKTILFFLCNMLIIVLFAQENEQGMVKSSLIDEEGNKIINAEIYYNEGAIKTMPDGEGVFSLPALANDIIRIEAKGYETKILTIAFIQNNPQITLTAIRFQLDEEDKIYLPFGETYKRYVTGSVTHINSNEVLEQEPGKSATLSSLDGRVPGLFGNSNIFGAGGAVFVVDGLPRPGFDINLQEVEQITVLKDPVSRMLYGTQAQGGVILVTTKSGLPYKQNVNAYYESGISKPISYPKYLNAADYMLLYNEAKVNDGDEAVYTAEQINNTRAGISPLDSANTFADEDYFNPEFFRNFRNYNKVGVNASGGNNNATYFASIVGNISNTILDFGNESDGRNTNINVRGNVDYKLNDYLSAKIDVSTLLYEQKGSNGDFWNNATTIWPNQFPLLIDTSYLSEELRSGASVIRDDKVPGSAIYGTFPLDNIYGEMYRNGRSNLYSYVMQLNLGFNVDLSFLTEGLSASFYGSYDGWSQRRVFEQNTYAVYELGWESDTVSGIDSLTITRRNTDDINGTLDEDLLNTYRRLGFYGTLNYMRIFNQHRIGFDGVYYFDIYQVPNVDFSQKNLTIGPRVSYAYNDKYIADISLAYVGSGRFSEDERYALSKGAGAAWIVSEENFLNGNSFLNYLKVRASAGTIYHTSGISDYYLYQTSFAEKGNFNYSDGSYKNNRWQVDIFGNPELSFAQKNELIAGFDAFLFNTLWLEASYFNIKSLGEYSNVTNQTPDFLPVLPLKNYDEFLDKGIELGVELKKQINDITLNVGYNMVYSVPEVLKLDEPNYEYDYLYKVGKPSDARFALEANGLFQESDFAVVDYENNIFELNPGIAIPSDVAQVQPGDIRYVNQNDDDVIDVNDEVVIGYSSARIQHGFTIDARYKGLQLFALATSQTGSSVYYDNDYYQVYGDMKYSDEVWNRYHHTNNTTGTYPRLTAGSNTNNNKKSSYWLYDNDWFKLKTVQLSYTLTNVRYTKKIQLYVRGSNLLTISEIRDKIELGNMSSYYGPNYRYYSFGINASF